MFVVRENVSSNSSLIIFEFRCIFKSHIYSIRQDKKLTKIAVKKSGGSLEKKTNEKTNNEMIRKLFVKNEKMLKSF